VKDLTDLARLKRSRKWKFYDKTKEIWRQTKKHQNQEMVKPKRVNLWQN